MKVYVIEHVREFGNTDVIGVTNSSGTAFDIIKGHYGHYRQLSGKKSADGKVNLQIKLQEKEYLEDGG